MLGLQLGQVLRLLLLLGEGGGHVAETLLHHLLFLDALGIGVLVDGEVLLVLLDLGLGLDLLDLHLLPGGLLFFELFLEVLDVELEFLALLVHLERFLLLLLNPGLHVVEDLFELLLASGQPKLRKLKPRSNRRLHRRKEFLGFKWSIYISRGHHCLRIL